MYACMCVLLYVCVRMYTYIMCARMYRKCLYIHTYIYTYIYICNVYIYIHIYIYVYIYIYICSHAVRRYLFEKQKQRKMQDQIQPTLVTCNISTHACTTKAKRGVCTCQFCRTSGVCTCQRLLNQTCVHMPKTSLWIHAWVFEWLHICTHTYIYIYAYVYVYIHMYAHDFRCFWCTPCGAVHTHLKSVPMACMCISVCTYAF
jgi:hypothetical protein